MTDTASQPPMRAYHGTREPSIAPGTVLRPSSTGEFGPGVYLALDKDSARAWGAIAGARAPQSGETRVLEVAVTLRNPIEITKLEWIRLTAHRTPRQVHGRLRAKGHDAIIGIGLNGHDRQLVVFDPALVQVLPTTPDAAPLPFTCSAECVNAHNGQIDGRVLARTAGPTSLGPEGTVIGGLEYAFYARRLRVAGVTVHEAARRRGVATALYEAMLASHPDAALETAYLTDHGAPFRAAFDRDHRERLAPAAPAPPPPFDDALYARLVSLLEAEGTDTLSVTQRDELIDLLNEMHDLDRAIQALPAEGTPWEEDDQHALEDALRQRRALNARTAPFTEPVADQAMPSRARRRTRP